VARPPFGWGAIPCVQGVIVERGFPQALPHIFCRNWLIGRLCFSRVPLRIVVLFHGPICVANQLRLWCSKEGLSCSCPVRILRRRQSDFLRSAQMERDGDRD
jgi:hypothetical protein